MDSKQKLKIKIKQTKDLSSNQMSALIYKLLKNFKSIELRSSVSQQKAFMHDNYRISYLSDDSNNLIGFMLWWDFDNLRFVEYILVSNEYRNNGIGSLLLKSCIIEDKPVIIEVEIDSNVQKFYTKNRFVKNKMLYNPIPLQKGNEVNKYLLYTYKDIITNNILEEFLSTIHLDEYQF